MSVIALWLGHEHLDTTHIYMEADLALKEKALNRLQPARQAAPRFRATDKVAQVKHVFVKAAARMSNRAENSHQPTRRRERQMCGFRDARRTLAFLSCVGPIQQHFALPRHQMNAVCHRAILKERLATWHGSTDSPTANEVI